MLGVGCLSHLARTAGTELLVAALQGYQQVGGAALAVLHIVWFRSVALAMLYQDRRVTA